VFPTPVGMNRDRLAHPPQGNGVPHARGDEPYLFVEQCLKKQCSPRPWG